MVDFGQQKFSIPRRENVEKVLLAIFDDKFRVLKYRFKLRLFQLASEKLNEDNNDEDRQYTEEST